MTAPLLASLATIFLILRCALQEYRPPEARLTLFLGNKGTNTLDNVQVMVPPCANYRVQVMTPAPAVLGPKTQVQVPVMIGATAPALDPPTLTLKYSLGSQQVCVLPTPPIPP